MSNLFGSPGQPVATQATRYNGMQVQASQYGMGLPIVYGQQRIAGTLIWYGDFQSVEHQQSVGKGGGGTSTSYTYSSSFQLALCEGPVTALATIWKDSGTTTLGDINGTFSAGASGQAAWSHLSGSEALQYTNTAWVGCINLALGGSPNVPNFNFEIAGLLQYGSGIIDADPSAIFSDLLTSATHGLGFQFLGSLAQYHDYCVANNIFLSLVVDQQTTINEILTRLLQITNSNTAWSDGLLTVIPYGDETVTANGVTYTPATTVQKSFQDSDYIKPVQVDRKPLADLYNVIRLEYVNRANNYNTSVAEAKDQADIDATFAIRQQEMIQGHAITNATLGQWVAQTLLQRALYIRNTYTFTTTMENVAFEPGDVIALTDSQAELVAEPVRIKSISEQGTNELQFVCEEFPAGVASGATQTVEAPAGYVPSVNGAPDATQPAVIFRAPQFLTDGTPEVWIGVGGAGSNWGGANVLVSLDNVTYQKVGTVAPGCRYGELTAALATSAVDPDTTNSYSVSLYAGGTLSGGTDAEADNLATLMLIDTELVAYSSTTLNGDGTYTLGNGYLRRGCYQTAIAAHSIGAPWIRVDDSVFRWQVDPSWVGKTVYIKIQPWNLYGGGLVSESSLTAITYVVGTAEEIPDTPPTPTSLTAAGASNGILLTWDTPNPAAVSITSVEYSPNGTTWTVLGQVQGTHYAHVFSGNATWYYRIRARSPAFIWSAYTATVSATGGSVDYVADGASFVKLLASHAAGNVAYNFKGIWSSATAYVKGDEVIEGQTYWVATAGSTNSTPSTSNANWQTVGSYAAFQGAWVSTTAYVPGSEVTYSGNYWICVTGNTNSAPTTSNANWQVAGPTNLDFVPDGSTFQRVYATAITTGQIDMSKAGVIGRTLLNIADGGSRYAVINGASLNGASYVDGSNNPRIDFTGAYHLGKSLANIPDATGRYAVTNAGAMNGVSYVDAGNRALIDFSQAGHTNKTLDNVGDGTTYARYRSSLMQNGVPTFAPVGKNLISNPGFELNVGATPTNAAITAVGDSVGDTWYLAELYFPFMAPQLETGGTYAHSGANNLVIPGPSTGDVLPATSNNLCRVYTHSIPVHPGDVLYLSGWADQLQNIAYPAGVNVYTRIGLWIYDGTGTAITEQYQQFTNPSAYQELSLSYTVPANGVSVQVQCTAYAANTNATAVTIPTGGSIGDSRFDDIALYVQVNLDNEILDGTTYQRTLATALTSGQVDLSKAGVISKTFDHVSDGASRFAVTNAGSLNGVSAVDSANKALIDFSQAGHTNKTLDNVGDGTTYARPLATALTSGQVDMSKAGVVNKTLANVTDGGSRYAVANIAGGNAVAYVDTNNRALIDFSQSGHVNQLPVAKVTAPSLSALSANLGTITAGEIIFDNGTFMMVQGINFGASSSLSFWFGPHQASISTCSRTNAYFAIDLAGYVQINYGNLNGTTGTSSLSLSGDIYACVPATQVQANIIGPNLVEGQYYSGGSWVYTPATYNNTPAPGTSNTEIANTAFVNPGFGSNANGYWRKNADGSIEQWGTVTPSGGSAAHTFPVAYTTLASINVQVTPEATTGAGSAAWSGLSTTGFTAWVSGVPSCSWHSIGY